MPTTYCDHCERKIRITPKRMREKTAHLCMFCSNDLPDKYRCEGVRKGTAIRCRQKQIAGGMCHFHQNQRKDVK